MNWENPRALIGLWLLPLVVWLLIAAYRRRRQRSRRFADTDMLPRLLPTETVGQLLARCSLVVVGLALLLMALARPQFGEDFEEVSARGLDLFVLLDVSRSMDASDVLPSRLERAKSDIKDVLMKLQGDRAGLIAFAGAAVVKVPLTNDLPYYRMILDDLDTAGALRGGSLIGDAIRKSLEAMKPAVNRDQVLLLITDGEDHDSFPREAANEAARRGVRIFTVGLGDAREGVRIPIRDEQGQLRYLQHDGQEVWSKLDEKLLREIALTTGGAYVPAGIKNYDLGEFYEQQLADLARGEYRQQKKRRPRDQFQWFLSAAILFLLVAWTVEQRPHRPATPASPTNAKTAPP